MQHDCSSETSDDVHGIAQCCIVVYRIFVVKISFICSCYMFLLTAIWQSVSAQQRLEEYSHVGL
jgi:hypothetical protein